MKNVIGMIPARLQSSRLPGKPLVDICGLPMIVHVLKRCLLSKELSMVFVVTDSEEVKKVVESHGGKVIMTGSHHETGTDRIGEAAKELNCDIIVNIQGDEALVTPEDIDFLVKSFINSQAETGILVTPFYKWNSPSDIKVVLNQKSEIMYASRNDIPSNARSRVDYLLKAYHVVAFKKDFLIQYTSMKKTHYEQTEFNEYLRILENGYKIAGFQVKSDAISVDTPEDLEFVRKKMLTDPYVSNYL